MEKEMKMTEAITEEDYFDKLKVIFVGRFNQLHCGPFVRREALRIGLMTGSEVIKKTAKEVFSARCPILFFNFPGEEYCWNSKDKVPRSSYFFDLAGERALQIASTLKKDFPCGFIPCHDPASFLLILDKMYESFFNHRVRKKYRLALYAEEFIAGVYEEHLSSDSSSKYEKIILSHAEAVHQDPAGKHDFNAFAARLEITPIHYRRLFKSVVGFPPYEYLQQCRLLLAITLLKREKNLQIQQIAQKCGFSSATEFSRFFKKQTNFSPLQYCRSFFE